MLVLYLCSTSIARRYTHLEYDVAISTPYQNGRSKELEAQDRERGEDNGEEQRGEEVDLIKSKDGRIVDPVTMEVFKRVDHTDPNTEKLRKTVRRHRCGPPVGATYSATKLYREEQADLLEEHAAGDEDADDADYVPAENKAD